MASISVSRVGPGSKRRSDRSLLQMRCTQPPLQTSVHFEQLLSICMLHVNHSSSAGRIQSSTVGFQPLALHSRSESLRCFCGLIGRWGGARRVFGLNKSIMGSSLKGTWRINTRTCFLQQTLQHQRASATSPHRLCVSPNRARYASVTTMATLQAHSTLRCQHDWHVLPDGTKLEVLTQKCDTVRHLPI